MATNWIELLTGSLEQKKQYRAYKARMNELPAEYREAHKATERYLTYAGGIAKSDVVVRMLEDLGDLFEQAAADGTPIRAIFGENPVEFMEEFIRNYSDGSWIAKERERFTRAIEHAESGQARSDR